MQYRKFRFRRRSGRRTGPGTGIGIAEIQIQYLGILPEKARRSINLVLRSIGRSISTSRYESTVRATTGPSRSRTSPSSWRRPTLPRVRIEVPRAARPRQRSELSGAAETHRRRARPAGVHGRDRRRNLRRSGRSAGATTTNAARRTSPGASRAPQRSRRACSCRRRRRRIGVISPPRSASGASVAVTVRLAKASEAAARVARPAPKPAQLRPAPQALRRVRRASRLLRSAPPASLP